MKKTHKEYHPAVDGLRAVSILAVVLYHVGVPGIRGGFVGVDVFFVISGFLIISQIARALESGTFSFADFVSRRALRILPPYFLVVFSVALVAPFVLVFPAEHERIGDEIAYSALMLSNFLYLGQEGYFDSSRDTKVLLHLWSLAVEEQFYLIAPIVGLGLHWLHKRFSGEIAFSVFIALGVVSLHPAFGSQSEVKITHFISCLCGHGSSYLELWQPFAFLICATPPSCFCSR